MQRFAIPLSLAALSVLAACAHPDSLRVGMTAAQLDARFGTPTATRRDPDADVRIYSSAPLGQRASAVYLDGTGTVFRVEPLLNTEHFATIAIAQWNKHDVLTHFGKPAEVTRIPGYEVWSYRYREAEQWDSMFHVMFDASGIVRQTQNGPDPMYEKRDSGHE